MIGLAGDTGLEAVPAHGDTPAALRRRADEALHRDRAAGRGQVAVA